MDPTSPVRVPTRPPPLGARLWAGGFALASRLRGERAIHADGLAFAGTLRISGPAGRPLGATLLDTPAVRPALVRFSRGIGLPDALPDIGGLAVKLPAALGDGRDQDLLLDTCGRAPVLRQLPLPVRRPLRRPYGSLLPYAVGGRLLLLAAFPAPGSPALRRLADLPAAARAGQVRLELAVATARGRWSPVGTLEIGDTLPAGAGRALRFSPFHAASDLAPAGPMQQWRRASYAAAQDHDR